MKAVKTLLKMPVYPGINLRRLKYGIKLRTGWADSELEHPQCSIYKRNNHFV